MTARQALCQQSYLTNPQELYLEMLKSPGGPGSGIPSFQIIIQEVSEKMLNLMGWGDLHVSNPAHHREFPASI